MVVAASLGVTTDRHSTKSGWQFVRAVPHRGAPELRQPELLWRYSRQPLRPDLVAGRTQEHDQLLGLAAGADDYISKAAPAAAILERLDAARRAQTATHFSLSGD